MGEHVNYIVSRIRKGDVRLFEAIYTENYHSLIAYARRFVLSEEEARGVIQDVFVRDSDPILAVEPNPVDPGSFVTLTVFVGCPNQPVTLWVTAFDSTPMMILLLAGNFNPDGRWAIQGLVPAYLSGHTVTFLALALSCDGDLVQSCEVTLDIN